MAPDRILSLMLGDVLLAGLGARAAIRRGIGDALPIDPDGLYLRDNWLMMNGLFADFDADLGHAETLGALASPIGRNQVFGAILSQNLAAVLGQVRCPVKIAQVSDDPLLRESRGRGVRQGRDQAGRIRSAHRLPALGVVASM